MAKREDGKKTRNRVLKAALTLFSRKGYSRVTVADICKKAGANQAAVNYYFRDKAGLYGECWEVALARFSEVLFTDPEEADPEVQLRNYIRTLISNVTDKGEKGHFSRLYMMELANPTGLIKQGWLDAVSSNRQRLHHILTRIMGRTPSRETLVLCELSIASQCRNLLTINPDDMAYFFDHPVDAELIGRMADHITLFSLAGIRAVAHR